MILLWEFSLLKRQQCSGSARVQVYVDLAITFIQTRTPESDDDEHEAVSYSSKRYDAHLI